MFMEDTLIIEHLLSFDKFVLRSTSYIMVLIIGLFF